MERQPGVYLVQTAGEKVSASDDAVLLTEAAIPAESPCCVQKRIIADQGSTLFPQRYSKKGSARVVSGGNAIRIRICHFDEASTT
jgi:hypothetical protein